MRFAMTIVSIVLTSVLFAATNMTDAVCAPATNAVAVKVSKKALKAMRPRCEATTLSGNRCKRRAAEGSKYCGQHTVIIRKREKETKKAQDGL